MSSLPNLGGCLPDGDNSCSSSGQSCHQVTLIYDSHLVLNALRFLSIAGLPSSIGIDRCSGVPNALIVPDTQFPDLIGHAMV